ncbi:fibrous sheath CABYR-binding protein isoform X2 [Danio aesculapii]|uniref:fibrous sheath CABYR-binding protein isoform X2 n=1 Tax=Danio aesculapii TaxID=1142201 RepID=UPI0024BFBCD1|nr:fibrous sheath CABYR-binding protein isoform X2 [Danio aesculapii]
MGLCSHNGLLVMLLFHLCHAQDDALSSPDPERAPPSLGDVIDAVKAAFEQAVQISTTGAVREALEEVVEELTPPKTPSDQSTVEETTADHTETAEEQAEVLPEEEPDAHILETSEQTHEEESQDTEPSEVIQGLIDQEDSSISEPVIKPEEIVLEATDSVQEPAESVLHDPEIIEEGEPTTEETKSDDLTVQIYPDMQEENKSGATEMNNGGKKVEEDAFIEEEAQLSEIDERAAMERIKEVELTVDGEGPQEEESVEMQEVNTESEPSEEERQAVTAQMGTDGGVVDMDEVEQEEEKQETLKEGVIEVEAKREEVKEGSEARLQKVSKEEVVPSTERTAPEVVVDTRGPIKLQEPVITKSEATGGKAHEASDVNEIIISSDPNIDDKGEPALMNIVEELVPTPILKLRAGETDGTLVEERDDSTQTKAIGQEAWKIGAIAAAFCLILQTAVTVVYIIKCRRKTSSSVAPKNSCTGRNACDANNTDTTIPIDEQSAVDDLLEYSQVQQEDVAMTTIPLDSSEKSSSSDPRTSVV